MSTKKFPLTVRKKVFKYLKKYVKKYKSILRKKEIDYLIDFKFTSSQFIVYQRYINPRYENLENSKYIQVHSSNDLKGRPISGPPENPTQQ